MEKQMRKKESKPILPPGQRQRKEEYAKSKTTSPRLTTPREKSFLSPASHSGAPRIAAPVLLFLFWTVHGPFSLFLLEEKEKMGGAKHQPSSWLKSPRPQGRVQAPSPGRAPPFTILHRSPEYRFCRRSFAAIARIAASSPTVIKSSLARVRAV